MNLEQWTEENKHIAGPWMVFNIGCIECGVSSAVVGLYETECEALAVADACQEKLDWREGGQNDFEVFNLLEPQHDDYRDAIESAGVRVKPADVRGADASLEVAGRSDFPGYVICAEINGYGATLGDKLYTAPQPAEQQSAPDVSGLVDALMRVMYCNEVGFLPESVQQAVSDALVTHRNQKDDNQ